MHYVKGQEEVTDQDDAPDSMSQRVKKLIGSLEAECKRRIDLKKPIEDRWLEDLRQYHGTYEDGSSTLLSKLGNERAGDRADYDGSTVFQNVTRSKTNAMIARLFDLLFPTDDQNWGINPTPVPELAKMQESVEQLVIDARDTRDHAQRRLDDAAKAGIEEDQVQAAQDVQSAEETLTQAQQAAEALHESLDEAKDKARLMEAEIADQLTHCRFQGEARDLIEFSCKIGTGVVKGPVLGETAKKKYQQREGTNNVFDLKEVFSDMPAAYCVDPWSYFPDPDKKRVCDSETHYERHLMNRTQMRKLARRPDIQEDKIRTLLKLGSRETRPPYLAELLNISNQSQDNENDMFHVWEFTGPLETDQIELLANFMENDAIKAFAETIDVLSEVHAKIWFCDGEVLSFSLHPLDSQESLYDAYCYEYDEAGPWGYGIPFIMRHSQSIINAATRMMLDNAGLATGPQVLINQDAVSPENGSWTLTPRKVWKVNTTDNLTGQPPFQEFSIDMHQTELANIITMEKQNIDEITGMPALAQGEQGAGVTKTAQGMAILMNSANVVFRRLVKNYDDDITTRLIRRFYHWNMQFSDKDEIKGDFEVDARGASVLLVREMQAQNLMLIAQQFGDHPVYGKKIDHDRLLMEIFKAHMIAAESITFTKQQQAENARREAEQVSPELEELRRANDLAEQQNQIKQSEVDGKVQMHNLEWQMRYSIAELDYETEMRKLAEQLNIASDQVEARLEEMRIKRRESLEIEGMKQQGSERRLAAEIGMQQRTGKSSGGSV